MPATDDNQQTQNQTENPVKVSIKDAKFDKKKRTSSLKDPKQFDFTITAAELSTLMKKNGPESGTAVKELYGTAKQLSELLQTDLIAGIRNTDQERRKEVYGINVIPQKKPKSFFTLAFEAAQDFMLIILQISAIINLIFSLYMKFVNNNASDEEDDWIESVAIFCTVIIVVVVVATTDWHRERQFRGLQKFLEQQQQFQVIRNGEAMKIPVSDILVGDICQIKYGDMIPADGIVIQSNDLKLDESSLTGESESVRKNPSKNALVLSGTYVVEGAGKFMVLAVGINSQAGTILSLLGATDAKAEEDHDQKDLLSDSLEENSKEKSVLQIKLKRIAIMIGIFGLTFAVLTFLVLIIRFTIETFVIKKETWSTIKHINQIVKFLMISFTVIVVAIPEGLPLAVTVSLAYSIRKMMKDNNLVRHLNACETMGNATTICSDKTGTLTTNRMTVVKCFLAETVHDKVPRADTCSANYATLLSECVSINCNYTSDIVPSLQPEQLPVQIGNSTECALLDFVQRFGKSYKAVRSNWPEENIFKVFTFNSKRKSMSTIIKRSKSLYTIFTKGAAEIIIEKCDWIMDSNYKPKSLTKYDQWKIVSNVIEPMAKEGLRTICVAYKNIVTDQSRSNSNDDEMKEPIDWENEANIINKLTCLGIFGIEDPLRSEVPEAIKKCQKAGIVVRMVTGDNVNTAESIAKKCGIVQDPNKDVILDSKLFNKLIRDPQTNKLQQELFDKVWPTLRVLARSTPEDKYVLVSGIIKSRIGKHCEVVAVTGDGTNDGPALKRADVGFSMGIAGTDIAKEASDIILTDDNFTSIVKAVLWGRNVYDGILKFLQFQLTVNIVAVLITFLGALIISRPPLRALQMLWINLIMDTFASLALATESPTDDLLNRRPFGRLKPIVSRVVFRNILFHSVFQLTILLCLIFHGPKIFGFKDGTHSEQPSMHFTLIFNSFVFMTLFNEINARKIYDERNIFASLDRNLLFIGIWIATLAVQVIFVQFGGVVLFTTGLRWDLWLLCFALGVAELIWHQIILFFPVKVFTMIRGLFFRQKIVRKLSSNNAKSSVHSNRDSISNPNANVLWMRGLCRIEAQNSLVDQITPLRKSVQTNSQHNV